MLQFVNPTDLSIYEQQNSFQATSNLPHPWISFQIFDLCSLLHFLSLDIYIYWQEIFFDYLWHVKRDYFVCLSVSRLDISFKLSDSVGFGLPLTYQFGANQTLRTNVSSVELETWLTMSGSRRFRYLSSSLHVRCPRTPANTSKYNQIGDSFIKIIFNCIKINYIGLSYSCSEVWWCVTAVFTQENVLKQVLNFRQP